MITIEPFTVLGSSKPIKEIDIDKLQKPAPKPYYQNSFRMMLIGPSGSGKSLIFTTLLRKVYNGIFTNVFIFCPTFYNDATLNQLIVKDKHDVSFLDEEDVFTSSSEPEIAEIVKRKIEEIDEDIKNTEEGTAPPKTLMVFDDLTNEMYNSQVMKDLFTKGRKHEISVIVMTNKYKVYDPQIRNNTTQFVIFKPANEQETKSIAEDLANGIEYKTVRTIMDTVFEMGQHPFLYVDTKEPVSSRFWMKFEKPIKIH